MLRLVVTDAAETVDRDAVGIISTFSFCESSA